MFLWLFQTGSFTLARTEAVNAGRIALNDLGEKGCTGSIGRRESLVNGGWGLVLCVNQGKINVVNIVNAERNVLMKKAVMGKHSVFNNSSEIVVEDFDASDQSARSD